MAAVNALREDETVTARESMKPSQAGVPGAGGKVERALHLVQPADSPCKRKALLCPPKPLCGGSCIG